jgi:hypothetical protein
MLHQIAPRPHKSVEERGQILIAARRQAQIPLAEARRVGSVTVFIDPLFFAVQVDLKFRRRLRSAGAKDCIPKPPPEFWIYEPDYEEDSMTAENPFLKIR